MTLKRLLLVPYLLQYVVLCLSAITPVRCAASPSMTLEVVQYNIFGRPTALFRDGQGERLEQIPDALVRLCKTFDVVTFAEAFDSNRDGMLAQFRKLGFNYSTSLLDEPNSQTFFLNGGVIVVSKWPILKEAQHVYRDACTDTDCLAAKGVKYARVLKTVDGVSKVFNVFATHMQAWSTPEGRSVRVKQAKQMRQFIDAMGIPVHEPLILAGDFNVDNQTFRDEVTNLEKELQAHEPRRIGEQQFTSDPHTNVLVGRDGAADDNKCQAQYVKNWGPKKDDVYYPSLKTRTACANSTGAGNDNMCYCPCCPFEWLDYVLYGQAPYQQPSTVPTLQALIDQAPQFTANWSDDNGDAKMAMTDLSDHYPVIGKFEFPVTQGKGMDNDPSTYRLDGCSSNSDCDVRDSRCYCKGPNCFYQGNYTNGWTLDSEHPVNRNCVLDNTTTTCMCGPI